MLAGDVVNNSALVFNCADTLTYNGVISGTGVVMQAGPGMLVFTAIIPIRG